MKRYFILIVCFLMAIGMFTRINAQELQCKVDVVTREIAATNKQKFRTLERSIFEFMNNTNWTNKDFKPQEKISCNLVINIEKAQGEKIEASARIKSSRPVYGSTYSTSILNYFDKEFNFNYRENQNINYMQGSYSSNLSSILAYYAYLIIGLDFDTFSKLGGTQYLQEADNIVSTAQSSPFDKGWSTSGDNRNRGNLVQQMLSSQFEPWRVALYEYHRKGLDIMYEETDKGRKAILSSLQKLKKVHERNPNSFVVDQFFESKSEEIINIFSEAPPQEKSRVMNLLGTLDPSNLSQYEEGIEG